MSPSYGGGHGGGGGLFGAGSGEYASAGGSGTITPQGGRTGVCGKTCRQFALYDGYIH